jgi:predicted GH43/DUF377 family glycosyl hydrolase
MDRIAFRPEDVDLSRSPLRASLKDETYVLGAFNPGLTRLRNGNLLLMVRVAEALRDPVREDHVAVLRWRGGKCWVDRHSKDHIDTRDPRELRVKGGLHRTIVLTSISWLLPVELSADGSRIVATHYDRIIAPRAAYQEYGVEDPRISRVDGRWLMTTCSVSAERLCTTLYTSDNALDWTLEGVVLDHQNKDMLIFEGRVKNRLMALTRPAGEVYLLPPPDADFLPGPAIQLAQSPDGLHWKPLDMGSIRPRKGSTSSMKVGGGTPPILTPRGWLELYHGVEARRGRWRLPHLLGAARPRRSQQGAAHRRRNAATGIDAQPRARPAALSARHRVHDRHRRGRRRLHRRLREDDVACRLTRIPKSRFA